MKLLLLLFSLFGVLIANDFVGMDPKVISIIVATLVVFGVFNYLRQ